MNSTELLTELVNTKTSIIINCCDTLCGISLSPEKQQELIQACKELNLCDAKRILDEVDTSELSMPFDKSATISIMRSHLDDCCNALYAEAYRLLMGIFRMTPDNYKLLRRVSSTIERIEVKRPAEALRRIRKLQEFVKEDPNVTFDSNRAAILNSLNLAGNILEPLVRQ